MIATSEPGLLYSSALENTSRMRAANSSLLCTTWFSICAAMVPKSIGSFTIVR